MFQLGVATWASALVFRGSSGTVGTLFTWPNLPGTLRPIWAHHPNTSALVNGVVPWSCFSTPTATAAAYSTLTGTSRPQHLVQPQPQPQPQQRLQLQSHRLPWIPPSHEPRFAAHAGSASTAMLGGSDRFYSTSHPASRPPGDTSAAAGQTPSTSSPKTPAPTNLPHDHGSYVPGEPAGTPRSSTQTGGHPPGASGGDGGGGSGSGAPPPPPPAASPGPPPLPLPSVVTAVLAVRSGADSARASLQRAAASLLAAAGDLGAKLNQVTGYSVIEQLKGKVDEATRHLDEARDQVRDSKAAYEALVSEQGEVLRQQMALLQRKGSWQAADVEHFTELCRQEHRLDLDVAQAKAAYGKAAEELESCHGEVAEAVRERYSAETLWSDKIRRASTWWTVALVGLNLVSFLSVYLVMEPIKARRLRTHVEEVMRLEMANMRQALASLEASIRAQPAAHGQATPADGFIAAGAAAAGLTPGVGAASDAARGAGMPTPAAADARTSRSALLQQLQHVKQHLAAVEQGLAAPGHQATMALLDPTDVLGGTSGSSEAAADFAASQLYGEGDPRGSSTGGGGLGEAGHGHDADSDIRSAGPRWHHRWGIRLRHVLTTPEVTMAASAFVGAALGVGMLLLLHGRNT